MSAREDTECEALKTAREEEQVFGERLLDDLMNTFCDKLQKAAQERHMTYEGMLAIQSITVEPDNVRQMITGKNRVIQIIFDEDRTHYVVLYLSSRKKVTLYDSLGSTDIDHMLTRPVKQQIQTMFGHLFAGGEVPVNIELNYEHQHDDWSCGYRAVACVTNLARSQNPVKYSYDLAAIYRFLVSVLSRNKCSWEDFSTAAFSKEREEASVRMTVSLRPDFTYTVIEGASLLQERESRTRIDSVKTSISPTTVSEPMEEPGDHTA